MIAVTMARVVRVVEKMRPDRLPGEASVPEQGHQQSINDGNAGGFGRREHAGQNTADDDDDGEQPDRRVSENPETFPKSVAPRPSDDCAAAP